MTKKELIEHSGKAVIVTLNGTKAYSRLTASEETVELSYPSSTRPESDWEPVGESRILTEAEIATIHPIGNGFISSIAFKD